MPKSVATFRTELMQEFGLAEDNDNEGTSPEAILQYINEGNQLFINHRAWSFRLKHKTQFIQGDATVNTEFLVSDVAAVLSSTVGWGNAGRIFCDYDVIAFTANDNVNTLTITSADIDRTHEVREKVLLMYELPADFNKVAVMHVDRLLYLKEDQRVGLEPSGRRFWEIEVKLVTGAVKKYLLFPYHTTAKKIYFMYGQKATDFTDSDAVPDLDLAFIEIPEPYWNFIKHYVSARIYRHLEELNFATEHENKAMEILRKAAVFDSKQHFGNRIPLRTEWDDPRARLGIMNWNVHSSRNI